MKNSSIASATGDSALYSRKACKSASDETSSPPVINDSRNRSDWLHLLEYEQHYRTLFNQIQQQKQQAPVNTSAVNSSASPAAAAAAARLKGVSASTGNASTTAVPSSAPFVAEHKKTKQSIERKCISSSGSVAGETTGNHAKKNPLNSKDLDKKV